MHSPNRCRDNVQVRADQSAALEVEEERLARNAIYLTY
jgi:hypothetical protein